MCATTRSSPASSQTIAKSAVKPCSPRSHVRSSPRPPGASWRPIAHEHELAGERAPDSATTRTASGAAATAPFMSARAAAADALVLDPRRLVRDRHRVEVAVQDDRRPRLAAPQAADHDRRRREDVVEHLDVHPDLLEPARVEPRRRRRCRRSGSRPRRARASDRGAGSRQRPRLSLATRKPMCAWRRAGRLQLASRTVAHASPGLANEPPRSTRSPSPRLASTSTPRRCPPCPRDRTGSRRAGVRQPATSSRA